MEQISTDNFLIIPQISLNMNMKSSYWLFALFIKFTMAKEEQHF